jgi:hypothetical protein
MGNMSNDRTRTAILGVAVALAAVGLYLLFWSGSEPHGTVAKISSWLKDGGECESVETEEVRLPIRPRRRADVAPANKRFKQQASTAALIGCGGLNGYISYFRFPTATARGRAVAQRSGLLAHELFCVQGPEIVINDLLGYDQTADFCRRLDFRVHRPPHPV